MLIINLIFFFFFFCRVLVVLYYIMNRAASEEQRLHSFDIHSRHENMSHNNCFVYMIEEIKFIQNSAKKTAEI